jgi:N-acetylglucosamine malate deacetylase 1
MLDHEMTSRLCHTACFGAMVPNFVSGAKQSSKPLRAVPHLYYSQPFGDKNTLGKPVRASVFVNISETLDVKGRMLSCHESQRAFLEAQQGIPDLLGMLRQAARHAGKESGFDHAEGFRQHLGQGFPQTNLLGNLLGEKVRQMEA